MQFAESADTRGPRRDLVGYGAHPPRVIWPNNATLALNFVLNVEEGSENSHAAGDGRNEHAAELPGWGMPDEYRDLNAESVYEYGSRVGVFRALRVFEELETPVTIFATAVALEFNPEIGEWIQRAGYDVCSHGWRWDEAWLLSRDEEKARMVEAIESITRTTGAPPQGWYCRYGPSVNTRELVVENGGFAYDSDAYNDDLPYYTQVGDKSHLVVPYNSLPYNDIRFVENMTPADFVDICTRGIDEYRREGLAGMPKMMSIGLHPRWIGQAARTSALREIIEYAKQYDDIWLARRIDIAEHWEANSASFTR
jgi:peptidoglycan/xylan/chitin deacetylase (PgdA/CDA1 family)